MGQTVAEKILSNHVGKKVFAGEISIFKLDHIIASDTTAPLAINEFKKMNGGRVVNPNNISFFIDHATPPPNQKISNLHNLMRRFAEEQNINLYDQNEGICHQVAIENDLITSGDLVIGADSHTCTYGAIGALATGVGSTDLAGAMLTGKTWMQVPETIRINLNNEPKSYVYSKDIILNLVGLLKSNGANYKSIEFYGDYLNRMTTSEKLTITNMVIEIGAKFGVICDDSTKQYADDDAHYFQVVNFDLSMVKPSVSAPDQVDNVIAINDLNKIKINQAFLGSCTNGRLEDLKIARDILKSNKVANGVKLIVTPASKKVFLDAIKNGVIADLIESGATITTPGCGLCVGTLGGVPSDDEIVISSSNRNFKGRMGNNTAKIYLASPATVAFSALKGFISEYRG